MNKKQNRKRSIRTKLMIVPITLVILSIIGIIISVAFKTDSSMKAQMKEETEFLLSNVVARVNDNSNSIKSIESMLESTLKTGLESVKNTNDENLTNEDVIELANLMQVDELNLYNEFGEMILSNIPENIGVVLDLDHPIIKFKDGGEETMIEETRSSKENSEEYYKYGAIRNDDGSIFQIGVSANEIVALSKQFQNQVIIDDLTDTEDVMYASYIDNNYKVVANSDESYIGKDESQSPEVVTSIDEEKVVDNQLKVEGTESYDVVYPVTKDGKTLGALRIGFYMDNVNNAIIDNIISVATIGLFIVVMLVFILYRSSREIITVINSFRGDTEMMAIGDFSVDVPEEMQARQDEFGEIARSNMRMKESIRRILKNVTSRAETVASHSEELTATSNQSERAADELAIVIQEIAEASTSQAQDMDSGSDSVRELERVMDINNLNIKELNNSTQEVNTLKDEGLELIRDLVDKTDETRKSVREIATIIDNTDLSAENIVKAIGMIRNISEQTNLLALNASIEAARAGEAGKGFAVVAEEIRVLAEESSSFTGEIETIVNDLTSQTVRAVDTMNLVEEIIDLQGDSVDRTDAKFQGISVSIEEIDRVLNEVNKSNESIEEQKERLSRLIENLAAVAEENAAGTQEASASVEEQNSVMAEISSASVELAEIAEDLNNAVSVFKV